jgi:hypothetical protein
LYIYYIKFPTVVDMNIVVLRHYPRPGSDRIAGAHHVHAGLGEALKGGVGLFGIVDHTGDDHCGGGVLQQVYFTHQALVAGADIF